MLETSKKYVDATNELNESFKAVFKEECDIKTLTPQTLALMQSYSKFVKASNEYVAKTSEMIDSIDNKLDELLKEAKRV